MKRPGATLTRDHGATSVEYAILVALIAAVIVAVVLLVGADALGNFSSIADKF